MQMVQWVGCALSLSRNLLRPLLHAGPKKTRRPLETRPSWLTRPILVTTSFILVLSEFEPAFFPCLGLYVISVFSFGIFSFFFFFFSFLCLSLLFYDYFILVLYYYCTIGLFFFLYFFPRLPQRPDMHESLYLYHKLSSFCWL